MREIKTQKQYTRRQLICDCVDAYIRNNPLQYKAVTDSVKKKRWALHDQKYALVNEKDSAKNYEMRQLFQIPEKLFSTIEILLEAHQQPRFFDVDGERQWFAKSFPQFFIPQKQ